MFHILSKENKNRCYKAAKVVFSAQILRGPFQTKKKRAARLEDVPHVFFKLDAPILA